MSDKHFIGLDITSFDDHKKAKPISRVTFRIDDEQVITAGDDTGQEMISDNPFATQAMANALLARLKGYEYHAYNASDANIDPAAELGDGVTVDGIYGVLARISDDGSGYPSLEAPGEAELEDEYPTSGPMTREFNRKIAMTRSSITKTAEEIRMEIRNEVDGLSAEFDLQLSGLSASFENQLTGLQAEFTAGLEGLAFELTEVENEASENLSNYAAEVTRSLGNLQAQIDGQIETYYYDYAPTLDNEPASQWTDELTKQKHEGDLFFDKSTGYAYRFFKDGDTWKWQQVQDTDITKALQDAQNAQDTADHKRRVFVSQPAPPYDVGDLWFGSATSDILTCINAREYGAFVQSDWEKRNKYTDDTTANIVSERVVQLSADLESITARVSATETTTETLASEAITSAVSQYYQSLSPTALQGGSWENTQPTWQQGRYIWTRQLVTYGDGSTAYTPSENGVCITGNTGADGTPGATGADGTSISNVVAEYYLSTSESTTTGGSWRTNVPQVLENTWLWTRNKVTYSDNSITYTDPYNMTKSMQESIVTTVNKVSALEIGLDSITTEVSETIQPALNNTIERVTTVEQTANGLETRVYASALGNLLKYPNFEDKPSGTGISVTADHVLVIQGSTNSNVCVIEYLSDYAVEYIRGKEIKASVKLKTTQSVAGYSFDMISINVYYKDGTHDVQGVRKSYPAMSDFETIEMLLQVQDKEISHAYLMARSVYSPLSFETKEWSVVDVTDHESLAQVSITADKINWLVKSGTNESNFTMTDRAIQLVSDHIDLTGYVTFNSLEDSGQSTINGDNITTGTISAVNFIARGNSRSTESQIVIHETRWNFDVGGIRYEYVDNETNDGKDFGDKLYLYTEYSNVQNTDIYPSIKLESVGRISIEAAETHGMIYMEAGDNGVTIRSAGSIRLQTGDVIWLFDGGQLTCDGQIVFP